MAQSDTQIILAIIIFLVLGFFILSWFLDQQCKSCRDKKLIKRYKDWRSQNDNRNRHDRFSNKPGPPTPIGPTRMDHIYDSQDYYNPIRK